MRPGASGDERQKASCDTPKGAYKETEIYLFELKILSLKFALNTTRFILSSWHKTMKQVKAFFAKTNVSNENITKNCPVRITI